MRLSRLLGIAMLVLNVGAALWFCAGRLALMRLGLDVPLTAEDLAHASWLGSPTSALHFTAGPMAWGLIASIVLMGLACAWARQSVVPVVAGLFLLFVLGFGDGEETATRIGILDGVVKVGCYVPASAECRDLLGLPRGDARSMYVPPAQRENGPLFADWYTAARKQVVSERQESLAAWESLPGIALLRAPLHWGHAAQLKTLLDAQRAEVQRLKQTASLAATPAR
jgi:hypothetical protein